MYTVELLSLSSSSFDKYDDDDDDDSGMIGAFCLDKESIDLKVLARLRVHN